MNYTDVRHILLKLLGSVCTMSSCTK